MKSRDEKKKERQDNMDKFPREIIKHIAVISESESG